MSSMVEVRPEIVEFDLNMDEPLAFITISNEEATTATTAIAFKVKTTMPKRYLVRPNQDMIMRGDLAKVKIILQTKERNVLVANPGTNDGKCKDKFLVQSVALTHEQYTELSEIKDKDAKEFSAKLSEMWKTRSKEDFNNTKLKCHMTFPAADDLAKQAKMAQASAASPAADIASPYSAAASPAASTPGTSAAAVPSSASPVGKSDQELRQRYSELVNYTVQLTAERDRIKNDYLEANQKLSQFREQAKLRRVDAVSGLAESQAEQVTAEAGVASKVAVQQGFQLWQLLLVALISFLVARLATF